MADEVIKACIDRLLPDHLRILAAQNAVKENPDNAPATTAGLSIEEIAVFTNNLWQPGRFLRVSFLDGDPAVQAKVQQYAQLQGVTIVSSQEVISENGVFFATGCATRCFSC
ncbi:MAG: hypothetical protein E6J44_09135 [Chloroflexi bacterium]|nr:MAG: hypothetical protein E6J44_09135 [Chloroflexota bacterium]